MELKSSKKEVLMLCIICYLQESHYFASEEIGCLPCDCYIIGSLSPTCDRSTGQCDCKSGVGGLKCDQCPNPYAQVTSLGCEGT